MEGPKNEFSRFAQNEAPSFDELAFGVLDFVGLDFGGLIWRTCVCHCGLLEFLISWVECKGDEAAHNEEERCLFSRC